MPKRDLLAVIVLYDDGTGIQAEVSRPVGATLYEAAAYAGHGVAKRLDLRRDALTRLLTGLVDRLLPGVYSSTKD